MVIKVQGGRVRVDDSEPRVIKIGGVGPQGPTGPTGVVGATAPVVYSSQTVSLTTDQANGVPVLDANGKLKTAQLPAMSISDTSVVASQAAMLALTAEVGDVAVRTDLSKSFILTASPASTLGNWQELLTPPDTVLSVNNYTGAVTLDAGDVGAMRGMDNLADLTNTTTARDNLGLGSLATKNTITSSDITDGTIVNADVNASAAIADSKLNLTTTVSGTAVSSTNKIVDASSLATSHLGRNGIIVPQGAGHGYRLAASFSADYQYRGNRFYLAAPMTVTRIAWYVSTQATVSGGSGDTGATVDIAIYDSTNTKVFSTGPISNTAYVAGTTTGISSGTSAFGSTGTKVISLATAWSLAANTAYYLVMHYGVMASGGTRAAIGMQQNNSTSLFGTAIGTCDVVTGTGSTTTAPSTVAQNESANTPIMALRTD